ncbi:cupin-like domain-containing protein [Sphingomonas sp. JC676]|nr:cupin-like domain-containing protein [Sphingomonas sp. JC676]
MHSANPAALRRVKEREAVTPEVFAGEIASGYEPVVLRGQVAGWPAVQAGREGSQAMLEYLARFRGGAALEVLVSTPEIDGRFFYSEDMQGFNFTRQRVPLEALLGELARFAGAEGTPPALYANAATAAEHFPGWAEANRLDLAASGATPRLWIGNAVRIATHFDASANVAAVVAGRRRFTLFPPTQAANMYVGPLDRTLAGPPVSMPDPESPDLTRYPRYAEALRHALVADLEPGDALFIPAIWWHHVRALDPVNVLVNYWWAYDASATPFIAMIHALMSIRDLPPEQKQAWRAWFDYLVFDEDAASAGDHLPPHVRSVLGPASEERTERLRAFLLGSLSGGAKPRNSPR